MDGLICVAIEDMLYRIGPGGILICVSMNFLRTGKIIRMNMHADAFNSEVNISVSLRRRLHNGHADSYMLGGGPLYPSIIEKIMLS